MRFDFGRDDFHPGQFVAYFNGRDNHVGEIEVGVVKRVTEFVCFVAYSTGDTCAATPFDCLIPIGNGYAMKALVERAEQAGAELWPIAEGAEVWHE